MTRFITVGSQLSIGVIDSASLGESRRAAKQLAEGFGFDDTQVTRICTIAAEVAANILKHAGSGSVVLQVLDDGFQPEFEVLGIDGGPGMTDVDLCMRDGVSTSGSAGTGLGAMSRLSTTFDLFSSPGRGTVVFARLGRTSGSSAPKRRPRNGFEFGAVSIAAPGELECGNAWRVVQEEGSLALLLSDGVGQGSPAATASRTAVSAFLADPFSEPAAGITRVDHALSGTVGAAAGALMLRHDDGQASYASVGEIYGAIITAANTLELTSQAGTLGGQSSRTRQHEYAWPADSIVIMHTNAISTGLSLTDYPGLIDRHPAVIAGVLYRDHDRGGDDSTVVVARYQQ